MTAKERGSRTVRIQEIVAGYLMILPAYIPFIVFLFLPILASIALAFTKYDLIQPPSWQGVGNFIQILADKRLATIYLNTFIITIGATFFNNLLGILLAMGVNRSMPKALKFFFRTTFFFPVITTTASMAIIWGFLLTKDRGVINWIIGQVGLDPIPWLASSQWSKVSVIIYDVWRSCGYLMVIYLAGLQGIPAEFIDAARIDGASNLQLIRYIRLPLLTPTTFFAVIISLIGAFQIFDNVYVLTGGGPGDASRTIAIYIYAMAFQRRQMGYASAISVTMMIVLVAMTLFQFWISRRWVHYE
jgi:multiple sugar transport system permease protein